jgi:hypothetical protein
MIKEARENLFSDAKARVRVAQVERSPQSATPRKRSSARARGARYQLKIKTFLEERGYQVQNIPPKSFFIPQIGRFRAQRNDIFGADLIAKRSDRETLWIQATKHKSLRKKIEVLSQFPWTDKERVLIIIHRERKSGNVDDIFEFLPKNPDHPLLIATIKRKNLIAIQREAFILFDPNYP